MRKLSFVLCLASLSGCASTTGSLQLATASQIGHNVAPEQVSIVDVDRGAMQTSWNAMVGNQSYACNSDDMIRRPYCVRR